MFLYNYVAVMYLLCSYAFFVCGIGFRGKNTKDERTDNEGETKVKRRNEKFFAPVPFSSPQLREENGVSSKTLTRSFILGMKNKINIL